MNGLYLQLHAYMLRIAIPYGTLNAAPAAQAGPHRAHLRQGLRPLHHPHQPAAALDQAAGRAGHPRRPGRGRHARHPDQRQLHPQPHRRPPRRRHRRRGRRSAHLGRGDPPVVDLPPRVLVPAAQVQDRGHRLARRTGRRSRIYDIGLRLHRDDDGRAGLRGAGRRRPGPHALSRPDDPRAPAGARTCCRTCRRSCASTIATAGATISYKARIKVLVASLGRGGVRPPGRGGVGARPTRPPVDLPDTELARIRAAFAPVGFETLPPRLGGVRGGQGRRSAPSPASPATTSTPHKVPGYAIVDVSLKAPGETPGRLLAPSRWSVVADLAERYSLDEVRVTYEQNLLLPHVKLDDVPAVYAGAGGGRPGHAEHRPDQRHHRLPGPGLLRAGQRPGDPHRPGHRPAVRRPGPGRDDRRAEDQDQRLHQRLRPPPRRPHRHPRRR